MQPKWLLQNDVFSEGLDKLFKCLKKKSIHYQVVKYKPFINEINTVFNDQDEDCVITYGSLNLIKLIQRTKKWIPGTWCNFANFCCSRYFTFYGELLLNNKYIMMPLQELSRRKSEIYDMFGDPIFIRPDKGDKSFGGECVLENYFDCAYGLMDAQTLYESPLILVSKSFDIKREWRFFIANHEVITGSQYKALGEKDIQLVSNDQECWKYADIVAKTVWHPDPIFAIDICEIADGFKVLEINSFSCSGFYDCDIDALVESANKLAMQEWDDLHRT